MSRDANSTVSSSIVSGDGTVLSVHTIGDGPGVVIVGGAFRSATDYLPLAGHAAGSATVHVLDRRGHGGSGPQGLAYSLDRECEDLQAVARATGARAAFGHSFGGLVVLETAARSTVLDRIAVYDPAISVAGSIPAAWLPGYRRLLDSGDQRGAFAHFVKGNGGSPAIVSRLPRWYLKAVLRLAIRGERWQRYAELLDAAYREHLEADRAGHGSLDRFRAVRAEALLLGGSRSPAYLSRQLLPSLAAEIPRTDLEVIDGLDHFAPDEKAPEAVADRLVPFLTSG
jgi:pimeloyl-ACP methyl ester carboxylesterase